MTREHRGVNEMPARDSDLRRIVLAMVIGAIGGGIVVALATRAIPRIIGQAMQYMMGCIGKEGLDPEEM